MKTVVPPAPVVVPGGNPGSGGGPGGRNRLKRGLLVLGAVAGLVVLLDRGAEFASDGFWRREGSENLLATAARRAGNLVGMKVGGEAQDTTYQTLDVFSNALALIRQHYLEPVEEGMLMDGAVRGIFEALDADSAYLDAEEAERFRNRAAAAGGVGLGLEKRYYLHVDDVLPGSPAAEAGIERGDALTAIGGRGTRDLRVPLGRLLLAGAVGSTVEIALRKSADTEPRRVTLERRAIAAPPVETETPEPGVGLVRVRRFSGETAAEVAAAVESLRAGGAEALVFDLRGSRPAGAPAPASARLGVETAAVFRDGVVAHRAERTESGEAASEPIPAAPADGERPGADLPVVALVNRSTVGPGEIVAAALGALPHGDIVGGFTAGRTGEARLVVLPDGDAALLSTAHLQGPDGEDLLGVGAAPTLRPDDLGLRGAELDEDDPELDFALRAVRHRRENAVGTSAEP